MAEEDYQLEMKDEVANILAPLDPAKKKKIKKVVIQDPADDSMEQLAEKTESLSVSDSLEPTFTGLKKKKKKQLPTDLDDDKENDGEALDYPIEEEDEGEGIVLHHQKLPWEGTDRDYIYDELLGRVFHIPREIILSLLEIEGEQS